MEYLKAKEIDIEQCQKLKKEVIARLDKSGLHIWDEEYPSDELIKEDILFSNARVIKEKDEIIAYACFDEAVKEFGENVFKEDNLYSFSRLMVKSGFTGKHVATFLINSMLKEMKDLGADGCGVLVHPINKVAIKMYERLGFNLEETKIYPYGEFHNFVLLFDK